MLRLRAILAVGLAVAAACNDESGPNISGLDPLSIAHVKIQPNVDTIFVEDSIGPSDTTHLAGTVVMKSGAVLTDAALAWESRNPQVASVNSAGTVQATGYGVATIVASAGEAATATVVVVPRFEQDTMPNIVCRCVARHTRDGWRGHLRPDQSPTRVLLWQQPAQAARNHCAGHGLLRCVQQQPGGCAVHIGSVACDEARNGSPA
jgi:hypothetical protein